jgi:hypothetical protein
MSFKSAWQRALALKLVEQGARLLPPQRASWAAAMRNEIAHIDDDHEALEWAFGSLRACLIERFRVHRMFSARAIGILWIVLFVMSSAYNLIIALAARLGFDRSVSALGWWMKDFQLDRFSKLANAMPVGLFAILSAVVVLFAASLNLNLRRRPLGFAMFCSATALSCAAWVYQLSIPAYLQAISMPHRWRIGICFFLTAAILSALRIPAPDSSRTNWPRRLQ